MIHGANLSVASTGRNTLGSPKSWPDLVLSVPDPDITSLSDSTSEDFESGPQADPLQRLIRKPSRLPVRPYFSSEFIGLMAGSAFRPKPENINATRRACAHSTFGYGINHN
jgi:hypothetical protein